MLLRAALVLAMTAAASAAHAACMVGEKETATCNEDGSTKGSVQADPAKPDPTLAKFDARRTSTLDGRRLVGGTPVKTITSVAGPLTKTDLQSRILFCMDQCQKQPNCLAVSGQPAAPWSWSTGTTEVLCKLYAKLPPQSSELAYESGYKHRWNCRKPIQKSSGTVPQCFVAVITSRLPKLEKATPPPMVKKPTQ